MTQSTVAQQDKLALATETLRRLVDQKSKIEADVQKIKADIEEMNSSGIDFTAKIREKKITLDHILEKELSPLETQIDQARKAVDDLEKKKRREEFVHQFLDRIKPKLEQKREREMDLSLELKFQSQHVPRIADLISKYHDIIRDLRTEISMAHVKLKQLGGDEAALPLPSQDERFSESSIRQYIDELLNANRLYRSM